MTSVLGPGNYQDLSLPLSALGPNDYFFFLIKCEICQLFLKPNCLFLLAVSSKLIFDVALVCRQLHCWSPEEACQKLASVRPHILVRTAQLEMLRKYHLQVCAESQREWSTAFGGSCWMDGLWNTWNWSFGLGPLLLPFMYTRWTFRFLCFFLINIFKVLLDLLHFLLWIQDCTTKEWICVESFLPCMVFCLQSELMYFVLNGIVV